MSMRDVYKKFKRDSYLYNFFAEKDIPEKTFEVKDRRGVTHFIPNEVVVEHIALTSGGERKQIENIIRKIDFGNGDVNDFLKHLSQAIGDQYESVFASTKFMSASLNSIQTKGEQTMKRNRTTQRRKPTASRSLRAEIHALEQRLAVDETGIEDWGDELATEEARIVDEGTGMSLTENEDQNALEMDNWPTDGDGMTASEKEKVASRLLKMAQFLLKDR
jgi:hypothetical protein